MNWSDHLDADQSQFLDQLLELVSIPFMSGPSSRSIVK